MRLKQIQEQLTKVQKEKEDLESSHASEIEQLKAQMEGLQLEKVQANEKLELSQKQTAEMVSENTEKTKECIALKDQLLQAEQKIKTKDESLAEAKTESEKLRTRIDNMGEEKETQQKEISEKEEQIKEITQQVDRLTKKEEMNGHLKDQYEEEV